MKKIERENCTLHMEREEQKRRASLKEIERGSEGERKTNLRGCVVVLIFIIPQTGQVEHKESPVPILPEVSPLLQISLLQYPLDHQLVEL